MNDLIEDILKHIPDEKVSKVKPRPKMGRPKSPKRLAKEKTAAEKDFIDNYESKADYRPEPQRLIKALAKQDVSDEELKQSLEDALLPRQLAFCKEYVLDFRQAAAAVRAGYSQNTAGQVARNLLQYRGVNRLIELYTQSNAQKITTVDPDWIIQKAVEIVTTAQRDGDKLRGLDLLARHLGMFVERTEITGKDGEAIRIEETKNKADEVARRLREMGKKAALSVVAK